MNNEVNIEPIIEDSVDLSSQEIKDNDADLWKQLVLAARQTKQELDKLKYMHNDKMRLLAKSNNLLTEDPNKQLITKREVMRTRLKYKTIHDKFQFAFDKFIGNVSDRKIIYVYQDENNQLTLYELDLNDILKLSGAAGTISEKSIKKLLTSDKEHKVNDEEVLKKSNAAWNGTYARLKRYAEKNNKEVSSLKSGLLMWKESKSWAVFKITNYGDIKEAYISSIFNAKDLTASIGKPQYYSHNLIKQFAINYIANVDNMGALLGEDVQTEFVDYAIKSSGFSLPGLQQYYDVIDFILEQDSNEINDYNLIKINIKNNFEKHGYRNKLLGYLDHFIGYKEDQIIDYLTKH